MKDFKVGDKFHIEFDAEVIGTATTRAGHILYTCPVREIGSRGAAHYLYLTDENATPLEPADWPPQVGDIWEADGHEYAVRQYSARPGVVRIDPLEYFAGSGANLNLRDYDGEEHATFKALNPVLVRRRENG